MTAPEGLGWASLTVWFVVNAVNVLQSVGFASRPSKGMVVNHRLGIVIALLAIPAAVALVSFVRVDSAQWVGPAVFVVFVVLMLIVDYITPVEFRSPRRPGLLIPYLVLFFGSILLMGAPMFWLNRGLWLVTVVTTAALLAAMVWAIRTGHG